MALGWKTTPSADDPRLQGHETTYQASRGGHFPPPEQPVPGAPKDDDEAS
ncbi:hypothetical protein SUDANB1_00452 [Streptomyces sp. enrichment culture]